MKAYKIGNKTYAQKEDILTTATLQIGWDDFEVVGSPTVSDDYVVEDFSTSNYITTTELNLGTNWEFRTRFKVGTSLSNVIAGYQNIFVSQSGCHLIIDVPSRACVRYGVGDGGNSYYGRTYGNNYILTLDDWFDIKLTYDGSVYKAYISSDNGETWLEDWSYESTTPIPAFKGLIGISQSLQYNPFLGEMALGSQNTWFKIFGESSVIGSKYKVLKENE